MRLLLLLAALNFAVAQHKAPASPPRPNVILIIADDLGYGDLSSYGARDVSTPHLDRLAAEGVRFTDFYANAPVCTPTRASLITGRYYHRLALLDRPLSTSKEHLQAGLPATGRSLPQLLKSGGYATALVGKWHLGYKPEFGPNRHGFDYFFGYLAGAIDWYTHTRGDGKHDLWENGTPVQHTGYFDEEVTSRAVSFISKNRERPFFLEVAYGGTHWPFQSPHHPSVATRKQVAPGMPSLMQFASDADAPTRADYVEILKATDAGIGRMLAELERAEIADRTLVIFVSDNGGEWLSSNAPFFHRKDSLWEGGIRVPAIFRWPGAVPRGRVLKQMGITMDLTATILAAAQVQPPASPALDGMDLLPLLAGRAQPVERTLFWKNVMPARRQRAVRRGDFKLLVEGFNEFLFDVSADPAERNDLAASRPALVRELRALLERWDADVTAEAESQATPAPAEPQPASNPPR